MIQRQIQMKQNSSEKMAGFISEEEIGDDDVFSLEEPAGKYKYKHKYKHKYKCKDK